MIGALLKEEYTRPPIARRNRLGPRKAAALTLAAYLKTVDFYVYGGKSEDETFRLVDVKTQWPNAKEPHVYPSASIIEAGPSNYSEHSFQPIPLEETIGEFDCYLGKPKGSNATVLWKESELETDFQLDFWLSNQADQAAVEAALGEIFNPSEEMVGILLQGPEQYYNREMRFTLLETEYMDTGDAAYDNEWRLRCIVRLESDIVSLREATILPLIMPCTEVIDPQDPEET